ncbi:hypothetical protein BHE74_00041407 [Ensete ventricosum]|nr:hypothetical protein BHE74_00041407 [Ensete ventricosum]
MACHLGLVLSGYYIWTLVNFSLALEKCAGSLGRRLVDRRPEQSPYARVDFWFSVELQPLGVCYDVPERVAYPWSQDLVWLASVSETSLFVSAFFRSSVGSMVVNTPILHFSSLP